MEQLKYDKTHHDSVFRRFHSPTPVTLSEVVKFLKWGNNNLIRSGGIRVNNICSGLLRTWEPIRDPSYIINTKKYISAKKGRTIIVVEIGG